MDIVVSSVNSLKGNIEIPADKSITHRAFLFSALTKGICKITNYSHGADCISTLNIIKHLGCDIKHTGEKELIINAQNALTPPKTPLNCGNSGTTTRLISGILSAQNFNSELIGDESLSQRPMKRIIAPLELMGAKIYHNNYKLPMKIEGKTLHCIDYTSQLSSAQVKSCILLAGLNTEGRTSFTEPFKSRNHTELMLKYMGANIQDSEKTVSIAKSQLNPVNITVCGDISSAAFFITAALIVPNSDVIIKNVGINPTRCGILDVYKKMNANIEILNKRIVSNEEVADIRVKYSELKSVTIEGAIIPRLIDELPIIALAATQAKGITIIKDAQDLRNKETDRISAITFELNKLGANITETPDGFIVNGNTKLGGNCECECYHDHRIAMSEYIAALICKKPVKIKDFEWVDISFPEFLALINKLIQ